MTQIFTGGGLGAHNSSLDRLGSFGPKGTAGLGSGNHRVYVNAANGNLVISQDDGFLTGSGLGFRAAQTYNSRGESGQAWVMNSQSHLSLQGSLNTEGSGIDRMDEDGHRSHFVYDKSRGLYLDVANKTTSIRADGQGFYYREGNSVVEFDYNAEGRLSQLRDKDGHHWDFHYEAGQLSSVSDNSVKQKIVWQFSQGRLCDFYAYSDETIIHHLHFDYDDKGRLTREVLDLGAGKTFWTAYDYEGDSSRIATLRQSDGISLHIEYDKQGRVCLLREGDKQSSRFDYQEGQTIVTNALGEHWIYRYDQQNHLTAVDGPEGSQLRYRYEGEQLAEVVQGNLHWLFHYNEAGDCIEIIKPDGSSTRRVFDAEHHLLSDDEAGQLSRYVYDSHGHLCFKINPDGVVTDYRYDSEGRLLSERIYLLGRFKSSDLNKALDLEQLIAWSAEQDWSQSSLIDYRYDYRGQLSEKRQYHRVDAQGVGCLDAVQITDYRFDASGRLLAETIYREQGAVTTSYCYDDLGRLIETIDSAGNHKRIAYDDQQQRIISTDAKGLVTIEIFDSRGQLLSRQGLDSTGRILGTTTYSYDAEGRLLAEQAPDGSVKFWFYDREGRLEAAVSAEGQISEYHYDAVGHLVQSLSYASRATTQGWLQSPPDFAAIRPEHNQADRLNQSIYNEQGQLVFEIHADGSVTGYHYNAQGLMTEKTRYSQRLTKEQLRFGQLLSEANCQPVITPGQDRHQFYFYDAAGRLEAAIDGEGYATEYRYNALGQNIETLRFDNRVRLPLQVLWLANRPEPSRWDLLTQRLYDVAGYLIATIDGEGYLVEYRYDSAGLVSERIAYATAISTSAPENCTSLDSLRPQADKDDHHQWYRYDARGLLIEEKNQGLITTYTYDEAGLVLSKTLKDSKTAAIHETRYRYDLEGRLIQSLDERGAALLLAKNPLDETALEAVWQAHSTQYSYDKLGRLTEKTNRLAETTRYFYDKEGLLMASLDADGRVVRQDYNSFGELIRKTTYHAQLHSLQVITDFTSLLAYTSLIADARFDTVDEFEYNLRGQLIAEQRGQHLQKERVYNAFGEVIEEHQLITPGHELLTSYSYDRRGLRLRKIEDPQGINRITRLNYDALGRLEKQIDSRGGVTFYNWDRCDQLIAETTPLEHLKTFSYDAFGRITAERAANGFMTMYRYDDEINEMQIIIYGNTVYQRIRLDAFGNRLSITDILGHETQFTYNEANQLVAETSADGASARYDYDSEGRLVWQENADKVVTCWTYDAQNRVLSQTIDPAHRHLTTTYGYDGAGRLIWQTEANGVSHGYSYDAAGRLLESVLDPEGLAIRTSYAYDERGLLLRECLHNPKGKDKITAWTYDALGRQQTRTLDPEGLALTTHYSWDSEGRLLSETDARGYSSHYIYDAAGQCRFSIDARGVVTEQRYTTSGKDWQTIVYNQPIIDLDSYDEQTLLATLHKDDSKDRYSTRYFDSHDRLNYTVDPTGLVTSYYYNDNNNLLNSTQYATRCDPVIPARGGRPPIVFSASDRSTRYVYDKANRLIFTLNPAGQVTERRYSPAGLIIAEIHHAKAFPSLGGSDVSEEEVRRAVKDSPNDGLTCYSYDSAGCIHAIANGNGEVTRYEYDGSGLLLSSTRCAQRLSRQILNDEQWFLSLIQDPKDRSTRMIYDAAGNERFKISAEGRVVEHVYDAVGNVLEERRYAKTIDVNVLPYDLNNLNFSLSHDLADRTSTYVWDAAGRLIDSTDNGLRNTHYDYDASGNVLIKRNAADLIWIYSYDETGHLLTSQSPKNQISSYQQGQWIRSEQSVVSRYAYDAFGNCISSIEDEGGLNRQRFYSYDANNHPLEIRYPGVMVYEAAAGSLNKRQERAQDLYERFVYNAFGEQVIAIDKAGHARRSSYTLGGLLNYSIDGSGAVISYDYDAQGRLIKKTCFAQRIALPADASTVLSSKEIVNALQADKADRHDYYSYDTAGRVIELKKDKIRAYNPATKTYSLREPQTLTAYNAFGEVIETKIKRFEQKAADETLQQDWLITRYDYNQDGECQASLDAEGYQTSWYFNAFGEIVLEQQYSKRLANPELFSQTLPPGSEEDRVSEYHYDVFGQLTTKTLKQVRVDSFNEATHRIESRRADLSTAYTYDALGQMISMTDAKGQIAYCYYDAAGHLIAKVGPETSRGRAATSYEYDALGQLVSTTRYNNGAAAANEQQFTLNQPSTKDQRTSYVYDAEGHLLAEINGEQQVVYFSYNENGQVARRWQLRNGSDNRSFIDDKRYHYDEENRLLQTDTMKNQQDKRVEEGRYNAFGELEATGLNGQLTVHNEYDSLGRLWRTNSKGFWQIYLYSLDGAVTEVVSASNHLTAADYYSDLSQSIYETLLDFADDLFRFHLQRQDNEYDRLGHLIRQSHYSTIRTESSTLAIEESKQLYSVDRYGNMLSHMDALGRLTTYQYNELNQVSYQKLPEVSMMNAQGQRSRIAPENYYAYDELGQAIAMMDANGHVTAKVYDAEGRVIREIDALGRRRDSDYNLLGQLEQRRNEREKGQGVINYRYDRNDRLIAVLASGSSLYYQYDEAGKLIEQHNGKNESTKYSYDSRDNLVLREDERGKKTSFEYDDAGHKILETNALNHQQRWDYDAGGRLIQHKDLGNHTTRYQWNDNGLLIEETSDAGKNRNYYYRGNGLLEQYNDHGVKENLQYSYDAAGQLIEKISSKSTNTDKGWLLERDYYEYDELGRLTSVRRRNPEDIDHRYPPKDKALFSQDYDYDAVGNIRHSALASRYDGYQLMTEEDYFTYDANDRMLINKGILKEGEISISSIQGSELVRDEVGNIIEAKTYESGVLKDMVYIYDKMNQLEQIFKKEQGIDKKDSVRIYSEGQMSQEFRYDVNGNLAQQENYQWESGQLKVVNLFDRNGRKESQTVYSYNDLNQIATQRYDQFDEKGRFALTVDHSYAYNALWDEAEQSADSVSITVYDHSSKGHDRVSYGLNTRRYDVNGLLEEAFDYNFNNNGVNHTTKYRMSGVDGLREKEDSSGKTSYFSINGKTIGDLHIDNDQKTQKLTVYAGFTPTGSLMQARQFIDNAEEAANTAAQSPQDSLGSYTIQAGDTLSSIAFQIFGDASLWYLLADANGISDKTASLQISQRLVIPSMSKNQHQTDKTKQVLNGQTLYGDTSATAPIPNPPPPPKMHKNILGMVIASAVAVLVTVMTAGVLASGAFVGLSALFSSGVGVLTGASSLGFLGSMVTGFVAGVAGNLASQGVRIGFGMQHGLDPKSALLTGLTTAGAIGVAGGINQLGVVKGVNSVLEKIPDGLFSVSKAAAMMEQDAVSQGLRLSLEKHRHFDLIELGTSGLVGGIAGSKVAQQAQNQLNKTILGETTNRTATSIGRASLQTALTGGHINAIDIVADSLGDGLSNAIVDQKVSAEQEKQQKISEEKAKAAQETKLALQKAAVRKMEQESIEQGGYCEIPEGFYEHHNSYILDETLVADSNYSGKGFMDYVEAFNHGMDSTVSDILHFARHPIDTVINITAGVGYMAVDGYMAALGIETESSKQRSRERKAAIEGTYNEFVEGDGPTRFAMLTHGLSEIVLTGTSASAGIDSIKLFGRESIQVSRLVGERSNLSSEIQNEIKQIDGLSYKFKSGEDIIHFEKHSTELKETFGYKDYSLDNYVKDANLVIANGIYVPELNAFVAVAGGTGRAKGLLVGLDRVSNEITTFHLKSISFFERKAPSLGWISQSKIMKTSLIGNQPHLGWNSPYRSNK